MIPKSLQIIKKEYIRKRPILILFGQINFGKIVRSCVSAPHASHTISPQTKNKEAQNCSLLLWACPIGIYRILQGKDPYWFCLDTFVLAKQCCCGKKSGSRSLKSLRKVVYLQINKPEECLLVLSSVLSSHTLYIQLRNRK